MSGFLHFNALEEDLYTLLSVVNGEDNNRSLLAQPRVQACLSYRISPESMLEDLVISCAVRLRMIEDRFRRKEQTFSYPFKPDEVCRFLVGEKTNLDQAKSGLRLACDKIVHAGGVSFYKDHRYDLIQIEGDMQRNLGVSRLT